jgi:hypothetical protein
VSNNRYPASRFHLGLGLLAATLLSTVCAHSAPQEPQGTPTPTAVEPILVPRDGETQEMPKVTHPKKNVCVDPDNYPPLAFDLPQLTASQILTLFNSPSTVRELLRNVRLVSERDLLVQSAFFEDDVLLKFFGASQITWENTQRGVVYSTPYPQSAIGPTRVAHVKALHGPLANVTVRVVSGLYCMGWRRIPFPPGNWWPPVTYSSGYMQIEVSSVEDLDVGMVKDVFGLDPAEAPYSSIEEFGGGVSFPANLTYENAAKERRSAPFDVHKVEFIPQQTGNMRPVRPGSGRRVFADETKVIAINITQREREL